MKPRYSSSEVVLDGDSHSRRETVADVAGDVIGRWHGSDAVSWVEGDGVRLRSYQTWTKAVTRAAARLDRPVGKGW